MLHKRTKYTTFWRFYIYFGKMDQIYKPKFSHKVEEPLWEYSNANSSRRAPDRSTLPKR